jgi:hypothetical protein
MQIADGLLGACTLGQQDAFSHLHAQVAGLQAAMLQLSCDPLGQIPIVKVDRQ